MGSDSVSGFPSLWGRQHEVTDKLGDFQLAGQSANVALVTPLWAEIWSSVLKSAPWAEICTSVGLSAAVGCGGGVLKSNLKLCKVLWGALVLSKPKFLQIGETSVSQDMCK